MTQDEIRGRVEALLDVKVGSNGAIDFSDEHRPVGYWDGYYCAIQKVLAVLEDSE